MHQKGIYFYAHGMDGTGRDGLPSSVHPLLGTKTIWIDFKPPRSNQIIRTMKRQFTFTRWARIFPSIEPWFSFNVYKLNGVCAFQSSLKVKQASSEGGVGLWGRLKFSGSGGGNESHSWNRKEDLFPRPGNVNAQSPSPSWWSESKSTYRARPCMAKVAWALLAIMRQSADEIHPT